MRVRIIESHQPLAVRIVQRERIFDPVWPLRAGGYAFYFELHPMSTSFVNHVNVTVEFQQVLKSVVLWDIRGTSLCYHKLITVRGSHCHISGGSNAGR